MDGFLSCGRLEFLHIARMKGDASSATGDSFSTAARAILRRGWSQFAGFELMFRLLGLAVFIPLTAWLTSRLISWSGSGAVSNYDLAGFFLSFKGLCYLTIVVTIGFALAFFEFGGLTALAISLQRRERIRPAQLFRFLALALPRLWRLSVRQFLIYLAIALPFLAVAGGAYLVCLTENDINYYLYAKPPPFWIASSVCVVAGLGFAWFAARRFVDWTYAVPLLLFAEASPAAALRESARLVSGRKRETVVMLLRWLALVVLLVLAAGVIIRILKWGLLGIAGNNPAVVLTMTSVLAVIQALTSLAVAILTMVTPACMVSVRFLQFRPDVTLPESLVGEETGSLRRAAELLLTSWVLLVVFTGLTIYAGVRLVDGVNLGGGAAITAHRGSSITAPENTMAAIVQAVEEGADFVEIDVQETKDGTVVLAHDKDLNRVFGINRRIWEVTYDELKDLDCGGWFSPKFSDQRLATLSQVIEAVKGRARLNIELKFNGHEQKLASEVVRIVREHDFAGDCILTSLDYDGIRQARVAGPGIRTGVIVTSALGDITTLETDLLSISAAVATRDLISRARRRNLEVHVWTVNDVPLMNTMISMGVDNIITDDPKLLGELRRQWSGLSNLKKALLQLGDFADRRF
jgi:glycerophosphoryl diester phosphodiesterase